MAKAPWNPQWDPVINPAVSSPMWPTEEYAIRDFKSGWRRQIRLVTIPPQSEIAAIGGSSLIFAWGNKEANRKIPYPPSFRRIPAKIIDPATGAST